MRHCLNVKLSHISLFFFFFFYFYLHFQRGYVYNPTQETRQPKKHSCRVLAIQNALQLAVLAFHYNIHSRLGYEHGPVRLLTKPFAELQQWLTILLQKIFGASAAPLNSHFNYQILHSNWRITSDLCLTYVGPMSQRLNAAIPNRRSSNADWWTKLVDRKYLIVRKKYDHKNMSELFQ